MSSDVDYGQSTLGYLITYVGGAMSWQSRLQTGMALSTTEAEYMVEVEANKVLVGIRDFLSELGMNQEKILLHCDN